MIWAGNSNYVSAIFIRLATFPIWQFRRRRANVPDWADHYASVSEKPSSEKGHKAPEATKNAGFDWKFAESAYLLSNRKKTMSTPHLAISPITG